MDPGNTRHPLLRRSGALLSACLLGAALTLPSAALSLRVDGVDRTQDTRAVALDGVTYVSLRAVSTLLRSDAEVHWADGTATVTTPDLTLTARPGETFLRANDRCHYIKDGVRSMDGSIMVPLRTLADCLGGTVEWDHQTGSVLLSTGGEPAEPDYTEEDLYWLARIISAESRGEPFQGKLAVGTVVLNRVASDEFPDNIRDVIFDPRWGGQFEPVRNGTVYLEPTEESVLAAQLCLQGAREAGESLYFLAPELTNNHWTMENCIYVTTIGCHWFYR